MNPNVFRNLSYGVYVVSSLMETAILAASLTASCRSLHPRDNCFKHESR